MALTFRIISVRVEVRFRATSTETGQSREETGTVDAPALKTILGAARWDALVKQAFRGLRGSFELFAQQQAEIEAPPGEPFVPEPEPPPEPPP